MAKALGTIVMLNGAPRSGKSSIAESIQKSFEGLWLNLGVDVYSQHITPPGYRPGIGLRPGGERPDLETVVPLLYAGLYESVAAHSQLGLNVVVDVGHHDAYSQSLSILPACARRLAGLPALLVGVRCPLEAILARRTAAPEGAYVRGTPEDPVPKPILLWQEAVHHPGIYDLEVDTSVRSPYECAEAIHQRLAKGLVTPTAFERLAAL